MTSWRRTAGFTLIELMVVVIIIAALAGMVLPHLLPASDKAKANIAAGDMASISLALKMYRLHVGKYPSTEEGVTILAKPSPQYNNEPYLEKEPVDPWQRPYHYQHPGAHNPMSFDIWSDGPDAQNAADDIGNWQAPSK